ncbi:MAG TPA: DegQ family serine endoprotease [Candidatus Acidoferrales bacterium]|nr:DegQ family serine endoprotease [Candidatus Acidoferrales bacterium]
MIIPRAASRRWPVLGLVLMTAALQPPASVHAAAEVPQSFASVARSAKPAVVNIFSTRTMRAGGGGEGPGPQEPFDEFFRHFFGEGGPQRPQRQQSLGSGFIISSDGYIVTNAHVVGGAEQIRVKLDNGAQYDAKLVGADSKTDVALIKIKPSEELSVIQLGDSNNLDVGDWVVAIGDPFGLAETVTAGIVSAKGRVLGAGPYDDFIQTDASINPGNSGGPLLNTQGEVVGINSAILSRSGGNVGIGFAIPINLARHIVDELRAHGKVTRGWLGVSIQDVTPALAKSFGLDHARGALVADLEPTGPAAKGGVERGDVILAYNTTPIEESRQLPALVADTGIGAQAELKVLRNGHDKTLTVTVAEQPSERSARVAKPRATPWGLALADLTPNLARRFGIPSELRGAIVHDVEPGSPADEAGIQPGDVITEVDRQRVPSASACQRTLDRAGDKVLLRIQRGEEAGYEVLSR